MDLFNRDNDHFDPRAAYQSDKSVLKIIVVVLFGFIITGLLIYFGYKAYSKISFVDNQTTNSTLINQSNITESPGGFSPQINVTFDGVNFTVNKTVDGIYSYTTKDKVTRETCYANDKRISCRTMTENYCKDKDCEKEVQTTKECFVNNQKVSCVS